MAQITDSERKTRINQLLQELTKQPPEKHEVVRLEGIGRDAMLCPVIFVRADELLLNHRSHRVRAQLGDDLDWETLKTDPHGEKAQELIARYIRAEPPSEQFKVLKSSLQTVGQANPGLITHEGVLINGNTRAVAIREFDDPGKRGLRVAVLPPTIRPDDLNLIELRLQMQRELKGEYSLTNELLFIEELQTLNITPEQIARELRIFPDTPKKGAAEVVTRLRTLDLIRTMRKIPDPPLRLTFFDKFKNQQMKEILQNYESLMRDNPTEAERYLQNLLLAAHVGVTAVHQIRKIDTTFMSDHMVPRLSEDEIIGPFADVLVASEEKSTKVPPPGVSKLLKTKADGGDSPVNVGRLLSIVGGSDKTVDMTVEGKRVSLDVDNIRDALKGAVMVGIREKTVTERAKDKLGAPAEAIRKATAELVKFEEVLPVALKHPDFDANRRNTIEQVFKRLRKRYREAEAALTKTGILPEPKSGHAR